MSVQINPKQKLLVISLIILGVLFTAFFGMRAVRALRKFDGHRPPPPGQVETDVELIREWMTISFISRTYQVPEKIIFDALGISPKDNHDKSLKEINEKYFPQADGLAVELVKAAILAHQPPPTAVPPVAP